MFTVKGCSYECVACGQLAHDAHASDETAASGIPKPGEPVGDLLQGGGDYACEVLDSLRIADLPNEVSTYNTGVWDRARGAASHIWKLRVARTCRSVAIA